MWGSDLTKSFLKRAAIKALRSVSDPKKMGDGKIPVVLTDHDKEETLTYAFVKGDVLLAERFPDAPGHLTVHLLNNGEVEYGHFVKWWRPA